MLCPVLGSAMQGIHGLTGVCPVMVQEDYLGTRASVIQGEAERAGDVYPEEEKTQGGISSMCVNT